MSAVNGAVYPSDVPIATAIITLLIGDGLAAGYVISDGRFDRVHCSIIGILALLSVLLASVANLAVGGLARALPGMTCAAALWAMVSLRIGHVLARFRLISLGATFGLALAYLACVHFRQVIPQRR